LRCLFAFPPAVKTAEAKALHRLTKVTLPAASTAAVIQDN